MIDVVTLSHLSFSLFHVFKRKNKNFIIGQYSILRSKILVNINKVNKLNFKPIVRGNKNFIIGQYLDNCINLDIITNDFNKKTS